MRKFGNKLWPHQLEAIKKIKKYLKANSNGTALVRMPTGTGKSGVISSICQYEVKCSVLVVVPWVPLRQQLASDIKNRFWEKIGYTNKLPKEVIEFTASSINNALKNAQNKDAVFICNVQSLTKLYTKQDKAYNKLKEKIKLVVFDEGHREPALKWAKAVRELKKPTILFTATPYRNDYKIFNIDKNFVYTYSYIEARSGHYVRDVKFQQKEWNNVEQFVDLIREFFKSKKEKLVSTPKVIIRCNTSEEVSQIAGILKNKGEKVIAIHESFKTDGEFKFRSIPSKDNNARNATFWVHQNKLIEGIDDHSFCILAIYKPFKNARSLVQQIGRISRNPRQIENQIAYVIINENDLRQKEFWEHYYSYEKYSLEKQQEIFSDDIIQIQPYYVYIKGDFQKPFDMESPEFYKHIRYRLSTYCFEIDEKFMFKELEKELEDEWNKTDFNIKNVAKPEKDTLVFLYTINKKSPILLDQYYMEHNLGFTICKKINSYLFFYDSSGKMCEYLVNNTERVKPERLQYLFYGENDRLTELSLLNADIGKYSVRRRVIEARSISDTVPTLGDFAHIPSITKGFTKPLVATSGRMIRRYVGFSRARISDSYKEDITYDKYIEWLENLANMIDSQRKILPVFKRYAGFEEPPKYITPRGILIDISDVAEYFANNDEQLNIEELYADVNNEKFNLEVNSKQYTISIKYDEDKRRYKLHSPEFEKFTRKESAPNDIKDNIIKHLNHEQSFRIVVGTPGIIYVNGRFYKPKLPIAKDTSNGLDIRTVLIPIDKLKEIKKEKDVVDDKGWSEDSLFGLIDNLGKGTEMEEYLKDIDLLICDDMGNEIADFIAANDKKVIFIHAKASSKLHKTAASELHTVCSQAVKNLNYLHPMIADKPKNINKWNEPWNKRVKRIRKEPSDPHEAWEKISNVVRDPTASREVWIVISRIFSLSSFDEDRKKENPPAQIIQILYLLLSTWKSISEIGATLRIFCSP